MECIGTCGGEMFVEKSAVIDAPTDADCTWKIETEPDRILALSAVNIGSFEQVQEYFTVIKLNNKKNRFLLW